MSQQLHFKRRKQGRNPMARRRVGHAFEAAVAGGGPPVEFPGLALREPERSRRSWLAGSAAFFLHAGVLGSLLLAAAFAPEIVEEIIPVQLLKEAPPPREEPAPAPKALAERRMPNFAPQVQTVAPQIVNPRVIAEAAPAVNADALEMEAVGAIAAPRQIARSSAPVVERVSVVNSPIAARASRVDVQGVGPAVRGPTRIDAPVGPSVGPRQVAVASTASFGTGKLDMGGAGSSVREGVISNRDVVGSPTGAPLVSIDTEVGEGLLRGGSGGSGTGVMPAGKNECLGRPEVVTYMTLIRERTRDRWVLPVGVQPNQQVVLRFKLDVAGSATSVAVVSTSDNALGASAVDALRAASPFPPLPERARCLARLPILGTFSNES